MMGGQFGPGGHTHTYIPYVDLCSKVNGAIVEVFVFRKVVRVSNEQFIAGKEILLRATAFITTTR